ncbi:MAG TPA: GspH/FimT family pseudopilin [Phycisphaerae bacterium]|nr:GspH/FimT family pseudopilin [Phycisphaerae bacterium]
MTSTTGPSADRPSRGGFTLLELIAVLVLISTVLAMAAPSLRGFVRGRQTADLAARVLALTRLARSRAVSLGCVHRLNVDAEEGVFWLSVQQRGAFVEIETGPGRRHRVPAGVSIALAEPSATEKTQEVPYVQFHPDGRCEPATIELAGGEDDVLQVICASPSEGFEVVRPEEGLRP